MAYCGDTPRGGFQHSFWRARRREDLHCARLGVEHCHRDAMLGRAAEPGEVVYIYAEGMRGIKQRYSAWLKEHGLTAAPNFRALAVPVDMLDAKTVGSLAIAILNAGLKPRLIVVDTVARCFGAGDENQTRDMNAFVKGCDDLREYL